MTMLAEFGGVMSALMVLHCIGDWLLQWQWMADRKTSDWRVRGFHCAIYTTVFTPFVTWQWLVWLFVTHFIIDSYKPLYWFRHLTRDPKAASIEVFKEAFNTPGGFYVLVTYDQIFHLVTMIPVALSMAQ